MHILLLSTEDGEISRARDIQRHVYEFYIGLMGSEDPKFLNLGLDCWDPGVSPKENEVLLILFTMKELEEVVKYTKTATTPGPDGFPVAFFKKFWHLTKDLLLQILMGLLLTS
jgi:hypothetical protein